MKIKRAREAALLLEAQPEEKFDMRYYFSHLESEDLYLIASGLGEAEEEWGASKCNTVVCLAGLIQLHKAKTEKDRGMDAYKFAMDWLGLNDYTAEWLFYPRKYVCEDWNTPVTKVMVLDRLRLMIAEVESAKRDGRLETDG